MFEVKQVLTGKKRKRKERGDPGDLEGYMGPWREFVDQVSCHLSVLVCRYHNSVLA